MGRNRARALILIAFTASLLAASAVTLWGFGAGSAPAQATSTVSAQVSSSTTGQAMGQGFVGVSLEYSALHLYLGRNPKAINPVLVQLLRNLTPGNQTPVLRIGGNSADQTWWPMRGVIPPPGVRYTLTPGWLATTNALARALHGRMIMDLNLAADRPSVAAAEAQALRQGLGMRHIAAFEIGNEPDVYGIFPWYRTAGGQSVFARPSDYSLSDFITQFGQWRAALGHYPVAGPSFAELNWLTGLPQFLSAEHGLGIVTLHRYPLRACIGDPSSPIYASIPNLLNDSSSVGIAEQVAPSVGAAHEAGLPFRVDEMNSASCSGKRGVSNTFAAAIWVLDTMFDLADAGVDGVNLHSLPGAAYELFSFSHHNGHWQAFVHPEYYGMMLFAQAFPPGARLLRTSVSPNGPLKVWATRDREFHTRVVLINKDPVNSYQVQLQLPALGASASLEWLQAPSVTSTSGVTLGGQGYGRETSSGVLPTPTTQTVTPLLGTYTITVPPASAALLTQ